MNSIFFPSSIDIFSTVLWGVVATAVGGLIVEMILKAIQPGQGISAIGTIVTVGLGFWIASYNIPLYGLLFLGNVQAKCQDGIAFWQKAINIQPRFGDAYLKIGSCYNDSQMYDAAIQWLEAGKAYESNVEMLNQLGYGYYGQANYQMSEQNLRAAVYLYPKNYDAHYALGVTFQTEGNFGSALVELSQAVDLNPNPPYGHFWLGWALKENGKCDQALAQFSIAIQQNANPARAYAGLGFCHMIQSNYGLARNEFQQALSLNADQSDVKQALSDIQLK